MKKLIFLFATISIAACAYAQTDTVVKLGQRSMNNSQNQKLENNSIDKLHPDGVLMQNGKMMKMKNGKMTILKDNDLVMKNGTRIMSDGTCIKKDGTKTTMKEGQHMDMSGNMVPMKNKDKNMYLVSDSTKRK